MAVTSGFFNSKGGDRKYNAEQISEFFGGLISSGVLPNPSTSLQVRASSDGGMVVRVSPGKGYIESHWIKNDGELELTIEPADSVLNRYDYIVMKLDRNAREITIEVKKGTPATSPKVPNLVRTETVKEFGLAVVFVGKTVTTITQSNINDTRANTVVCGWVTGLIEQVDTSELFIQYQTAYEEQMAQMHAWMGTQQSLFETWFKNLSDKLEVTTYVKKFHKVIETTAGQDQFTLDMDGYTYEATDVIFINANGVMLTEVYDYMIYTGVSPVRIDLANDMEVDNLIEVTVLKSVMGATSTGGVDLASAEEVEF